MTYKTESNEQKTNSDTDNSTVVRGGVMVEDEEGKGGQIYDNMNDNAIYRYCVIEGCT